MNPSAAVEMTGQAFGRLVVLERAGASKYRVALWRCLCECGNEVVIGGANLRSGRTNSCGCLHRDQIREVGKSNTWALRHGHAKTHRLTTEYRAWTGLRQRCKNPNATSYKDYGGRGILVCKRWDDSFENFYEDMGPKPGPGYSIDRIDNNGNYEPDNCRWATSKEQNNNQRPGRGIKKAKS